MSSDVLWLVLAGILAVPMAWWLPRAWAMDAVAAWSVLALAAVSWRAAAWLLLSTMLTHAALLWHRRQPGRAPVLFGVMAVLIATLLCTRESPRWAMAGAAYFTLRQVHVLMDAWMGRGQSATLRDLLRYQCFVPTLAVGPIHRLPAFQRELMLRRPHADDLIQGAERVLLGLFMAACLGGTLSAWVLRRAQQQAGLQPSWWMQWGLSALEWVQLYAVFAGLSGVAVGLARAMGITLEENFNRPYLARDLLSFWQRWHISLSNWCRDYVFQPVTARCRQPIWGLVAAMLAIGLWHQTSWYYVGWSVWQVLGIVLNRLMLRLSQRATWTWPEGLARWLGPLWVLAWLSAARPVLHLLEGLMR